MTELNEFFIMGISVKTTNQNGQAMQDIGGLFGKFFAENIIEKIPNKASFDVYCMYTDYEGDFMAPYTTIIGCKVSSLEKIPEGLVGKKIPATKYKVFNSKGKLPECVGKTWGEIWQSNLDRKYLADFDVYGMKALDPNNAEVETYVSVK